MPSNEQFPLYLIPLLPLLGAAINLLVGRRMGKGFASAVALSSVAGACVLGWSGFHLLTKMGEEGALRDQFFGAAGSTSAFTDAMAYDVPLGDPAVVIQRGAARSIVRFKKSLKRLWVLNLVDLQRSDASFDHFSLFALLPWTFEKPNLVKTKDPNFTGGNCWGIRYVGR